MARIKRDLKRINANITSINYLFINQLANDYNINKVEVLNKILDKARLIYFKDRLIL